MGNSWHLSHSIALAAAMLIYGPSAGAATYDFSLPVKTIQGWVDRGYYPGAALLVARDDVTVFERYFGNNQPDTVVFIASAGKWLAAATIAAVVDDGKLTWDDPVAKWLPQFTDAKGRATLRQLLSHTSGYPDYQPRDRHRDDYQTLAESVAQIVPLPPVAEPGTRFLYGGLAMQVAGRMAELASGMDWENLFQAKIARPLGMTQTHFTPVDSGPGHSPMLGGGARSTARDYLRFLRMIRDDGVFDGRRVLSDASIQEMQADQVRGASLPAEQFVGRVRGARFNAIYGLGEWREVLDAHGAAIVISSPSWAGAYPWIDKSRHLCGIFLAHVDVAAAARDKFNAFYASPVLYEQVGRAIDVGSRQ
jgi:CubicO group peptidase (beta-lactamase class C family)